MIANPDPPSLGALEPEPGVGSLAARGIEEGGALAAFEVDGAGRVLGATAAAAAMLECEAGELAGRALQDLAAGDWSWVVRNALLRLASGSADAFELLLVGCRGRRTLVQMAPQPRPATQDARGGYLLVCQEQNSVVAPTPAAPEAGRRLAYELLKSHDLERRRVAAELHEGIAPLVTMAKLMTEVAAAGLARGDYDEAAAILANTAARLRETLAAVERISTELEPRSLDELGLLPTIEWYCRRTCDNHPGLKIVLDLSAGEGGVARSLKVDIFRVVQEALLNVGRHAHASEVRVALVRSDGCLKLVVRDDGVGFDAGLYLRGDAAGRGLGLHSIRKRVAATGGSLQVTSAPWQGTTIGASWALLPDTTLP